MNNFRHTLGSIAAASMLFVVPLSASAATSSVSGAAGVVVTPSGIVRVIGASVTSVENGVVDAMTTIGNVVLNWVVNVSATTHVAANGSRNATTTDIKAGDKVSFAGSLTGSSSTSLTVAASAIRDITTLSFRHIGAGVISSINTTDGSFVITEGSKTATVQTNSSTVITLSGASTTLASLQVGERVGVVGSANADGSVITASRVVVKNGQNQNGDNDGDEGESKTQNNHRFRGFGGLHFFGGLHLGKDE